MSRSTPITAILADVLDTHRLHLSNKEKSERYLQGAFNSELGIPLKVIKFLQDIPCRCRCQELLESVFNQKEDLSQWYNPFQQSNIFFDRVILQKLF